MMREKFNTIVTEGTSAGWQRGIQLFIEELNSDMERDEALNECTVDAYLEHLVLESEQSK